MDIARLIAAAGGEIAGKVRLQKVVYLLDQLGLDSGLDFEYHHYGPYSETLADLVTEAVRSEEIQAETKRRLRDGVPYFVYESKAEASDMVRWKAVLSKLQAASATVLELAATAHWLVVQEKFHDWRSELRVRKGVKTESGRVEQAVELLNSLGLQPAT